MINDLHRKHDSADGNPTLSPSHLSTLNSLRGHLIETSTT
jgi:hypothetical protein